MRSYFQLLENQRNDFYKNVIELELNPSERPMPEKWSVMETIYHLILMVRLVRRFSTLYLPLMLPYGYLRKNRTYKKETYNIYEEYNQVKKRAMRAPLVLTPKKNIHQRYDLRDLQMLLISETNMLKYKLSKIDEKVAGQIHYPDPIAYFPNVIQSVHLLAIHEQHHFNLVIKYEQQKVM